MKHPIPRRLALRAYVQFVLPAAFLAFVVMGSAPVRAQNPTTFQASYNGLFTPQFADDGSILFRGIVPGAATFQPQSVGYFTHYFLPANPNVVYGLMMLFGGASGTLFGTYQGTQTGPDAFGVMQVSGTYNVPDGWLDGFGPAVGSGTFSGTIRLDVIIPANSSMSMTLDGTIAPAASGPS